jgi:ATP-dependent exoDNAse (exonuclease V) alpha subunit
MRGTSLGLPDGHRLPAEKRKDAQLAREIEIGLPVELTQREQIALARDYARREFVAKGMVADLGVHLDNPQNPHAHILLTTRTLTEDGFGAKDRTWNDKRELLQWRRGWAEVTNEHLAEAGLAVRIWRLRSPVRMANWTSPLQPPSTSVP